MYYTQRLELADSFLALFSQRNTGMFNDHWSSDWHMGEKISQMVWTLEGDILGVAEFFIETSACTLHVQPTFQRLRLYGADRPSGARGSGARRARATRRR